MKYTDLERLIEKEQNEIEKLKLQKRAIDRQIDDHIKKIDRYRLKQRLAFH